ncbi:MAG: ABC transporter ATP-binding protein [Chamaesiphon sp.]
MDINIAQPADQNATSFPTKTTVIATSKAVHIEGLFKSYRDAPALLGIDLTVQKGEVVGILGPNGAGKTTLLECIEGLQSYDAGQVKVLGIDVSKQPKSLRGKLSVAMQATVLPPALKVVELISLYQAIYSSSRQIQEILELVGLEEKAQARVSRLSGGQKQRLALALALLGTSEMLVLDEPTSELDPQGRRVVWQTLERAVRAGQLTVIITTHQMEEAATLCDRVVILDHGRIIAEGSPQELVQLHCPGLTLVFSIEAALDVSPLLALEPNLQCVSTRDGMELRLACDDFNHAMRQASRIRAAVDTPMRSITVEPKTLEDVFLKLTGRALRD